ncbi:MAG: UDP-N-acetylmuramoyl-L-alanine--D-glutamate ligase [Bacteroidota bacterium]|jgi:UDP-N-acetylmuramoylalanine--D-glutamate ligase
MNTPLRHISILGAGESGTGAAILAKKQGWEVFVSDLGTIGDKYKAELNSAGVEFEEKQHTEARILQSEIIVKSPGIPDKAPLIVEAHKRGIQVISEIEFASWYTQAKTIAITGTNGKTTTTLLTYHILKNAGLNVGLAGNVGKSFARQVAENNFDYYVLELSSFQLDGMFKFKADIAVLLNITPDHLDRYDYDLNNYIFSKFRILQNMDENCTFIYCADDPIVSEAMKTRNDNVRMLPFSLQPLSGEGAFIQNDHIQFNIQPDPFNMSIFDLALQGKHNQYNSMAAGIAARVFEIRKDVVRESLMDFENIEHRLEFVAKVHGIEFINDSKATNVNSTWYALESMSNPVVWIVGGVDKGNDYTILEELVRARVKAIVCMGKDNAKIHKAFKGIVDIVDAGSAIEAVKAAYLLGKKGDTVLLSPACASFDLFENYEDRGRQFKAAVREL